MIEFKCSRCGKQLKVKDEAAGKRGKCPQCGTVLQVPDASPEPTLEPEISQPSSSAEKDMTAFSPGDASHSSEQSGTGWASRPVADDARSGQIDQTTKIAMGASGVGLLILALSPLFKWVNFGGGGVTGISGDGKIVLGVSVLCIILYPAAVFSRKQLVPVSLGVGAWGTVALFWMAGLIWKVGSIWGSPDVQDNLFATILATQVSPGAGLYLGLIGGLIAAAATGYLAVQHLRQRGRLWPFYAAQGGAIALGMLVAVAVGPERPSKYETAVAVGPERPSKYDTTEQTSLDASWVFRRAKQLAGRVAARAKWRTTHNVSYEQWDEMIANFTSRKLPESVSMIDWWEEAKDKTPAQLNKLYPPLQPRESYRAEWAGGYSNSRELKRNFNYGNRPTTFTLTLRVRVRTEPGIPIRELHGDLAFVKDGKVIYEVQVAEKPDVSFTDNCFLWLKVDPYNDHNETHRTLRYAKDNELTPVFTVSKVILADGTEKTFD